MESDIKQLSIIMTENSIFAGIENVNSIEIENNNSGKRGYLENELWES